ncbi:MAG: hypothetical protein PHF00_03115 [Elusimicrobia bacterium]|nr:hypothetical protein [Elusimicrobiota bacterium]
MRKKGLLSVKIPGLTKTEEPSARQKLVIDYPQPGETVRRGHYAIRVSGGNGESQISIDDGEWHKTRSEAGFEWFDWFPETPGSHRIAFRTRTAGKWARIERVCNVE